MTLAVPVHFTPPFSAGIGSVLDRSWSYRVQLRYVTLLLGLVACTLALVGVVAANSVYTFTQAAAQSRLADGEAAFDRISDERQRQLETLTLWLGRDVALRDLALAVDNRTEAALFRLLSLGAADFIGVEERSGGTRVVPTEMAPLVIPSADGEVAPSDLRDDSVYFNVSRGDGGLFRQGRMKLQSGGSVMTGYFLGRAFAEEFSARTGLDITLFANGRVTASSLPDVGDGLALRASDAGEALSAAQDRGISGPSAFSFGKDAHDAFYFPLRDRTGEIVAAYAVSLPSPQRWQEGSSVDNLVYLGLVALLALAVFSGLLLARRVVVPIGGLRQAVSRIGHGDFATPLAPYSGSEEVRPLALELEEMRRGMVQALNQLAIERSLYKGTFHAMADGVFTTNELGMMTSVNPALLGSLGEELARNPGGPCCGTGALKDAEGRSLCDRACTWLWLRGQAEPVIVKGQLETTIGAPRDVEVTVTPIKDDDQQTVGLVHVVRDISAQEDLQRLKERFLMSVSHELRTPLSSLSTSVDFLKDEFLELGPEDRVRLLETVHRGTRRLQALTTNLLDLGSIQAGSFSVRTDTIEIEGVLQEALAISEVLLAAKGQRAVLEAPPGLPAVRADPVRIVQVVANLVTNASKYGPEADTILISAREERNRLRVAVTDHGGGMPVEEKERVFEYFYRGAEATRTEKGFGIGLAIVKGIVDAHKGEVGVESEDGVGTSFWFTLPVER